MAIERLVPESADRIAIPQETSTNKCFTDESHVLRLLTISPLPVPPFQLYPIGILLCIMPAHNCLPYAHICSDYATCLPGADEFDDNDIQ